MYRDNNFHSHQLKRTKKKLQKYKEPNNRNIQETTLDIVHIHCISVEVEFMGWNSQSCTVLNER